MKGHWLREPDCICLSIAESRLQKSDGRQRNRATGQSAGRGHAARLEEAQILLERLRKLEPGLGSVASHLSTLYLTTGQNEKFVSLAEDWARQTGDASALLEARQYREAFDRGGRMMLLKAWRDARSKDGNAFTLAGAHALLGDDRAALASLDQALDRNEPNLVGIVIDRTLLPLHKHPGFAARVKRAGFTTEALQALRGDPPG